MAIYKFYNKTIYHTISRIIQNYLRFFYIEEIMRSNYIMPGMPRIKIKIKLFINGHR